VSTAALTAASTPQAATEAFVAAINGPELKAAAGCFTREARLITPDSTAVSGRAEIRAVLDQMIAQRFAIAVSNSTAIAAGEIAHLKQRWRIQIGAEADTSLRARGRSAARPAARRSTVEARDPRPLGPALTEREPRRTSAVASAAVESSASKATARRPSSR
jgi:ketosteroid isomerase-like protein